MAPVLGLSFNGRIPPAVEMKYVRRCLQIKSGTSGTERQDQYLVLCGLVETTENEVSFAA